jgi:LysM repeat protein
MANGQIFNMYDPTTTACNIYPFGTWIRVTNPANGRFVVVQVRDRGAFNYALDLSYAAFKTIADPVVMGISVKYQVVSGPTGDPAPTRATTSSRGGRPAPPTQYVVQAGDNLSSIAQQVGVDEATLATWNGLADSNLLAVGQTLRLTAPPVPPSPTATASQGSAYVVQPGDTILGISLQLGVSADQLTSANGITDPTTIQIGQTLTIPSSTSASPRQRYVVQPGDTLSGIAQNYGMSVGDLLAINHVADPDHIPEGMTLVIPGG